MGRVAEEWAEAQKWREHLQSGPVMNNAGSAALAASCLLHLVRCGKALDDNERLCVKAAIRDLTAVLDETRETTQ